MIAGNNAFFFFSVKMLLGLPNLSPWTNRLCARIPFLADDLHLLIPFSVRRARQPPFIPGLQRHSEVLPAPPRWAFFSLFLLSLFLLGQLALNRAAGLKLESSTLALAEAF